MKTMKRFMTVVLAVVTLIMAAAPAMETFALGNPVVASKQHKVTRRPSLKVKSTFSEANLSWKAVKYAEKYEVWRKEGSKGTYELRYSGTDLKFTDGIANNVTYYYKVRAVGPLNYKDSSAVKVAPKKVTKAPSVKVKSTYDSVTLTWKKVSNVLSYEIYRSEKKNSGYALIGSVNELKFVDYTVETGKTYYYKVKADGPINGKLSKAVKATPKLATPKVKVSQSKKNPVATVTWNEVEGAVCYDVFVATKKNGKYTKIAEDYVGTKLEYGKPNQKKTYYFKVTPKLKFEDWLNDPVIQAELYAIYVMKDDDTLYEYRPKIYLFANETFVMEENVYEGIARITGDFTETENTYKMEIIGNEALQGFTGEDVKNFELERSGDDLIFRGNLCMTYDGAVFEQAYEKIFD